MAGKVSNELPSGSGGPALPGQSLVIVSEMATVYDHRQFAGYYRYYFQALVL